MKINEVISVEDATDNVVLTDDQLVAKMAIDIEKAMNLYGPEFLARLIIDINDYKLLGTRIDIELSKRIKRIANEQEQNNKDAK